jgi:predicted dehydrogenase
MKVLIVGLGSMGKRRIRCLKALGYTDITGFDLSEERRREAGEKYGIRTAASLDEVDLSSVQAIIISTPPHIHNQYIELCIRKGIPGFVEASVILEGLEKLNRLAKKAGVLIAPSCTMNYHPAIKDIQQIVRSGRYGRVTNFSYHSGYYLPDWHPWEKVTDYYVSRRETGGAREILPFELTWIVALLGRLKSFCGYYGKTMDVKADIEDTYLIAMDFGSCYGVMITDVASRYLVRSLTLNMEEGQILWNCNENIVHVYEAAAKRWIQYTQPETTSMPGYTKVSIEEMYTEELKAFLDAVQGKGTYPNTLEDDIYVLGVLNQLEAMNASP